MHRIFIDEQLPPQLAPWLEKAFPDVEALSAKRLGMVQESDQTIFQLARSQNAVILTKDADYKMLYEEHGPPPSILILKIPNCSNATLRQYLLDHLPLALTLLKDGSTLVEL